MKTFSSVLDTDGLLTVTINLKNEPMNVVNQEVLQDFYQLYEDIESNDAVRAVILTSDKENCFVAGADIKMLQAVKTAEDGTAIVTPAHTLLQKISKSKKPFIAAINGACLGAGYELSLACHYRIASDNPSTKIGLPEVTLGLLPGATGTTLLSRLLPLPTALDILLTGKQLVAKRALKLGMIDEVVPETILQQAAATAAKKLIAKTQRSKKRPITQKILKLPGIREFIIYKARQGVIKKTHGLYPAPLAILEVVQKGFSQSLTQALSYEAKKFGELAASPEAKQLINIYFATTALKKANRSDSDNHASPIPINKIGVLGGGLMGAGITTVSIDKANIDVRLKDINDTGILSAYRSLYQYYQKRIQRKILSRERAKQKQNQLTSTLDYSGFDQCDLVIEAVSEDLNLKQQMVADIEALDNKTIIFASNTSSIPISDIAAKAQRPENIIGMHYFSPVEKMPLLEIIKHPGTSDQTLATAITLGQQQGKTVIVVKDSAGFYINRILTPYLNAAFELGLEGVAFDKIDQALVKVGFPVGPIKLLDEVGVDVGCKILPILENAFGERMKSTGLEQRLLSQQRLGKKVKKGFYRYDKPKNSQLIDPSVYSDLGIHQSIEVPEKTIVKRCLYRMLNEAAICLEDKVVDCPRDGDIGAIFGIGFPPFLGGPFRYMDSLGIPTVVDHLYTLEKNHGTLYKPAENLRIMAEKNNRFY